jgi:VWFA-related protein
MFTGVIGAVLCAGVLTAAQAPQPRQQPPVFRANTELVEIDVVVVDKAGTPVHGLTRDDFVLRDRRKPQLIETFTEVRRDLERANEPVRTPPGARADVASNTTEQSGRLVVLVLDDLHVWRGRTETVKEIARKILSDLGPESPVALLHTGRDHSTEVTTDRARILESIDRFQGRREFRRPLLACNPQPLPPKNAATVVAWEITSGCNTEEVSANFGLFNTMEDAARMLSRGNQRRKAFILVSENIAKDFRGLFDGGTQTPDAPPDSSNYVVTADPLDLSDPGAVPRLDWAIIDMMRHLRDGNVATYAIDPRGEITSQELESECHPSPPGKDPCVDPFRWRSWIRLGQQGLGVIAEETGGFAVVDTDDFPAGIGRILDDLDNYYLLGFYTTDLSSKGYRPIDVVVKDRPDLTLRYRRGYLIQTAHEDASKTAKAAREPLSALIETALPASDFPMRVHALPMPSSGNRSRVAISLELTLPTTTMAGQESERLLDDIRYGVFAVDLKGQKIRESTGSGARIALRPRPGLTTLPDQVTYQLALEMELPAGRYQLRAAAISDKLGAGGSVFLPLDVPDFSKPDLAMTDLLLAYADGPHVPVARDFRSAFPAGGALTTRGAAPAPRGVSTALPVVERPRPLPFDPTLDRIFAPSDVLRLFFKAVTRSRRPVTATISARTADGTVAVSFDRPVSGDGTVDVRLPLAQLTPGGYRLEVVVKDGERTATKDVGFAIK